MIISGYYVFESRIPKRAVSLGNFEVCFVKFKVLEHP